jgi:SAM-dependent methyltransferase
MENDAAGFAMREAAPRFARMAGRHENGTAPRAVVAYQLFQTPAELAQRMAGLLNPKPGARILEPSSGLGRLLDAVTPFQPAEIVAVELAPECAGELFQQERAGVTIKQRDFLTCTPAELGTFDAVIMNPPFHLRSDLKHIQHALTFLRPGGRLVALCLDSYKRTETLRPLADSWEVLPAETFKETGTKVNTVLLRISQ